MALDLTNLGAAASDYASRHPREIIELALNEFGPDVAISFSGAEDVVLVDLASKTGGRFTVFTLDTGRLHPETYQFLDKVRDHYGIPIHAYFPQPDAVQALVAGEQMRHAGLDIGPTTDRRQAMPIGNSIGQFLRYQFRHGPAGIPIRAEPQWPAASGARLFCLAQPQAGN